VHGDWSGVPPADDVFEEVSALRLNTRKRVCYLSRSLGEWRGSVPHRPRRRL
jgi:hypothetical protein